MPNSGTVTAGSVALASQYNNLRSDVLDASTGHTHTGAADAGAQIEGTVIKSTGATVGAVLTAGTGGTATTWTVLSGGAGALGSAQVNVVWQGQAYTDPTYETQYQSTLSGGAKWTFGGGGTEIYAVQRVTGTTPPTLQRWTLGNSSVIASTAIAAFNTSPGTAQRCEPLSYGFNSGTAVLIAETVTSGGSYYTALRKWNNTLTSNMWNTAIVNRVSAAIETIPFYTNNCKYEPSIGIWYSWEGLLSNASNTAMVYIVNDVSGSVYSAPFGTTSINDRCGVYLAQYVPPSGAGNGTVYAWGTVLPSSGTITYRRVTYSVGSASISAVSTADRTLGWDPLYLAHRPTDSTGNEIPYESWWDAASTAIVLKTRPNQAEGAAPMMVGLDRTAGTVLFRSLSTSGTVNSLLGNDTWHMQPFDPVTRLYSNSASNNTTVFALGSKGEFYYPTYYTMKALSTAAASQVNGFPGFVGAGSATDFFYTTVANGTTAKSIRMVEQWTAVEVLAASTVGRIVSFDITNSRAQQFPVGIRADGAYPLYGLGMNYRSNTNVLTPLDNPSFPMYLPANAAMTAVFARQAYYTGNVNGPSIVAAATASFAVRTLAMA